MEHSNNFKKQGFKNSGPNLSENAATRICKAEHSTMLVLQNIDNSICRVAGSSEHAQRSLDRDLSVLVDKCVTNLIFQQLAARCYACFRGFIRDPFRALDMSSMFAWINEHKLNMQTGLRAR